MIKEISEKKKVKPLWDILFGCVFWIILLAIAETIVASFITPSKTYESEGRYDFPVRGK